MTAKEAIVVAYHIEQLDLLLNQRGIPEPMRMKGLMHLELMRTIMTGAHGADDHARKRGRRPKPRPGEMDTASPP